MAIGKKTKQRFLKIRHPKGNFWNKSWSNWKPQRRFLLFESLESLLKEVDGVVICTPAETHFEIACKALENGVDILVEKPIAITCYK